MSVISNFLFGTGSGALVLAAAGAPDLPKLQSPWAKESHAEAIVYSDMYGPNVDTVSRETAMQVAPIKRGRSIIVGSLSDLTAESGTFVSDTWTPANRQPTWLTRSRTVQTPWHRMAWTLDDVLFHGWSLWLLDRSETGTILDATHLQRDRWAFDNKALTGISIDGRAVHDPSLLCLFQGPDEGVLTTGAELIRGARAMERAWVDRVQNPIPAMVLQEVNDGGGSTVTEKTAQMYVDAWRAARSQRGGAIGFMPANLKMETYGEVNADLFTEGRNNVRLDAANLLNLPASLLDGSTATASLTYQTAQGEFSQLNSWLEYWLAPIEARLSQDDITPQGQIVRFDRSNLTSTTATHGPELNAETPETAPKELES